MWGGIEEDRSKRQEAKKNGERERERERGGGSYGGSRNLKGSAGYCLYTVSISLAHLKMRR